MQSILLIHTDGGSRGNPGPAACAFVVETGDKVIYSAAFYLGKTTNNVAEYSGVIKALEWILKDKDAKNYKEIYFYLDSELIVRQILGAYRVKDAKLKERYLEVKTLLNKILIPVSFKNVPREKNKIADHLLNKELDSNS